MQMWAYMTEKNWQEKKVLVIKKKDVMADKSVD